MPCKHSFALGFNPLPSQKQGETPLGLVRLQFLLRFQSAPLTKARGDFNEHLEGDAERGFNPLPSQKQGETQVHEVAVDFEYVSIRSPHKSKGRLLAATAIWG